MIKCTGRARWTADHADSKTISIAKDKAWRLLWNEMTKHIKVNCSIILQFTESEQRFDIAYTELIEYTVTVELIQKEGD
jgi:hypothetical protein